MQYSELDKETLLNLAPDSKTKNFMASFLSDFDLDDSPSLSFNGQCCNTRVNGSYLMPEPMVIGKGLEPDTKIYHFMPLVRFVEMMETQRLFFKRITEWDDPWEMPYRRLHLVKDKKNREKVNAEFMYGICWTREGSYDTDAMWRIYSADKQSVCFSTTVSKLYDVLKSDTLCMNPTNLFMADVIYTDFTPDKINSIINSDKLRFYPEFMYPAFLKRREFSHENEIRLLLFKLFFGQQPDSKPHCKNGALLPLNHTNFIDEVILDPRLNEYEEYIQRNALEAYRKKIGSIQKSSLYTADDNFVQSLNEAIKQKDEVQQGMPVGAKVYTSNGFCPADIF